MPEDSRLKIERFTLGPFQENCYLLTGPSDTQAAIVDPGFESEGLLDLVAERGLTVEWIVNTHGHLDHTAANAFWKERTGAPLIIHPGDAPMLANLGQQGAMFGLRCDDSPPADSFFEEGEPFGFDGLSFDVIHTPGHSPGGVCLRLGGEMLVGDTLFQGSVGRVDLPGGDGPQLVASIRKKLFALPDEVRCWPGHGLETTLGEERRTNPFVGDAAAERFSQEIS